MNALKRNPGFAAALATVALLASQQPAQAGIGSGHVIGGFALGVIIGGLLVYWKLRGKGGI